MIFQWITTDADDGSLQVLGDQGSFGVPTPDYGMHMFSELTPPQTCTSPEYVEDGTTLYHVTGYTISEKVDGEWSEGTYCEGRSYTLTGEKSVRLVWKQEPVAYRAEVTCDTSVGSVTTNGTLNAYGYFAKNSQVTYTAVGGSAPFYCWMSDDVPAAELKNASVTLTMDGPKHLSVYFRTPWVVDGNSMTDGYWTLTIGGTAESRTITASTGGSHKILDLQKSISDGSVVTSFNAWYIFDGNAVVEEILLPATLTTVECFDFRNCTALRKVDFGGADSQLNYLGCNCFSGCSSLTTVTPLLPEGVHRVWVPFNGCPIEGDLRLGYGADQDFEVEGSSFDGCHNLSSIDLGPHVTRIGHWAFRNTKTGGNTALTSVRMTDRVTWIGQAICDGCVNLTSVTPLVSKGLASAEPNSFNGLPVTGTLGYGCGTNDIDMAGNYARNTQIDTIIFGEHFTGIFTGHWALGGLTHLKSIIIKGDRVLDFNGTCGTFENLKKGQVLVEVPYNSAFWDGVMADSEQVKLWNSLDSDDQDRWTENFPGKRHPDGMIVAEWGATGGWTGLGHSLHYQWIQIERKGGTLLMMR